jgi:long-chain acyl-CoA synthetase
VVNKSVFGRKAPTDEGQVTMPRMRDEVHYGDRLVRCYVDRPLHVDQMFTNASARHPNAVALVDGSRRISYAELDLRVGRIAANLAALGIGHTDRVALMIANRSEFVEVVLAVARLGAISVPINVRQQKPEIEAALADSEAKVFIHDAEVAARVPDAAALPALKHRYTIGTTDADAVAYIELFKPAPAPPRVAIAEDDVVSILYTSGTTGQPKGAMLTHLSVVHSCLHYRDALGLGPEDVSVLAVPASHVTGLVAIILTMMLVGGRVVILPAFNARRFLELASAERISHTILVPAMYNLCLLDQQFDRYDLSSWRVGGYGGAPMPLATIDTLANKCPRMSLCNAYGATETTSPTTLMPLGEGLAHADSVGKVVPCGEVRVMDEFGREVATGESGEIWIAGPMVVPGYWNNPQANAQHFVGGYWKSGDIGARDADGYFKVFDRKKDMINRGGFKVYSAEVENVLSRHPAVLECAAVARPDPVLGEKVQVFVVARADEINEAELKQFCAQRLADYKVPDYVTVMPDALPRNANGKVLKEALKQRIATDLARPPQPGANNR